MCLIFPVLININNSSIIALASGYNFVYEVTILYIYLLCWPLSHVNILIILIGSSTLWAWLSRCQNYFGPNHRYYIIDSAVLDIWELFVSRMFWVIDQINPVRSKPSVWVRWSRESFRVISLINNVTAELKQSATSWVSGQFWVPFINKFMQVCSK